MCGEIPEDECYREDFVGKTGTKSYPYNPDGNGEIVFYDVNSGGLSVNKDVDDRPALMFGCYSMYMELDEPRDYVTFSYYDGTPGATNFIAVDRNGDVIDITTRTADAKWVIVHLENPGKKIKGVYMHQVTGGSSSCGYACNEPYITNINACDHNTK